MFTLWTRGLQLSPVLSNMSLQNRIANCGVDQLASRKRFNLASMHLNSRKPSSRYAEMGSYQKHHGINPSDFFPIQGCQAWMLKPVGAWAREPWCITCPPPSSPRSWASSWSWLSTQGTPNLRSSWGLGRRMTKCPAWMPFWTSFEISSRKILSKPVFNR